MNRARLTFMFFLLTGSLLLLPASAQETPPATKPAASPTVPAAEKPAAEKPAEKPTPAEEADAPPDLGENVSADNSVSFPVDI